MSKQLLFSITANDCEMQTFTVGGPGGGGKDTANTGVRFIHPASGAVGECREHRRQAENKKVAWRRLANHPKMQQFIKIKTQKLIHQLEDIDQVVEKEMELRNLRIEVQKDNKWVKYV